MSTWELYMTAVAGGIGLIGISSLSAFHYVSRNIKHNSHEKEILENITKDLNRISSYTKLASHNPEFKQYNLASMYWFDLGAQEQELHSLSGKITKTREFGVAKMRISEYKKRLDELVA